jgi:DNA ligase (NAD+)
MEIEETIQTAHDRVKLLREKIDHLNYQYHTLSVQEVPDPVFDSLKRELAELEVALCIDDKESPTKTVGATAAGSHFEIVKHYSPMLSLANVFSPKELMEWVHDTMAINDVLQEDPKLDGLSLDLVYKDRMLKQAITRGDGFEGEDVTENAVNVWGVITDLGLSAPMGLIQVRGEVVVTKDHFNKINEELRLIGKKLYANPRNYAAGSLRLKNSDEVLNRRLNFVAYEVVFDNSAVDTWTLEHLQDWGFNAVPFKTYKLSAELYANESFYNELVNSGLEVRPEWPWEIDGLVYKVADRKLRDAIGQRSSSPKWATAYKFPAEEAVSFLWEIRWQVGKSGAVTPVAGIKPVRVCGVTVSSVNLHNCAEIERLDLRIGDHLVVTRRGDVIPKIESVMKDLRTPDIENALIVYPKHCPSCGCELERHDHSMYCPNNTGCSAQSVARLDHFVSRDALNIKHLGEATLKELVRHGLVGSFSSLFYLGDEDLKVVLKSDTVRRKVLTNIHAAKTQPFRRVLLGVGIPEVGEGTSERLAVWYKNFGELCEATQEELERIPDIGEETAKSIVDSCIQNRREFLSYDKLFTYVEEDDSDPTVERDLEGKRVIVSGTSFDGLSRSQMEANVKARGAKLTSSVSPNLDILFAGPGAGPEKIKKALKLGFVQDGIQFINPKGISNE